MGGSSSASRSLEFLHGHCALGETECAAEGLDLATVCNWQESATGVHRVFVPDASKRFSGEYREVFEELVDLFGFVWRGEEKALTEIHFLSL